MSGNPFANPPQHGGDYRQGDYRYPDSNGSTPWQMSPRHSVDGGNGTYTPYTYNSVNGAGTMTPVPASKRKFKSSRLREDYPKPWLQEKEMKKTRVNNIIVGTLIFLGFCAAGVIAYFMSKPYIQRDVSHKQHFYANGSVLTNAVLPCP